MFPLASGRRDLLHRLGAVTALAALPVSIPLRAARGEIMTALMIANASISLLRSFSSSGDGGLGAMLRAQGEKLDLISRQISQVQVELGKLAIQVGQLPAEMQEQLTNQSIIDQVNIILGAAAQWREITARASYKPEGRLAPNDDKDLQEIRKQVRQARSILAASEMGERPLSATAGMVTLALEVSVEARLNGTGAGLKEALDSYIEWFERIENPARPTSAAAAYKNLSDAVVASVQDIFRLPLLANDPLNNVLIGDAPPATWYVQRSVANCYEEYRPTKIIPGRYKKACDCVEGGEYWPEAWGHTPKVHHAWRLSYDTQAGVRSWSLQDVTVPLRTNVPASAWTPDFALAACSPERVQVNFASSMDAAQQVALQGAPIVNSLANAKALRDKLEPLNILEARRVFVARALDITREAKKQATAWRSEIA